MVIDSQVGNSTVITLNENDKVYMRGNNQIAFSNGSSYTNFIMSGSIFVEGDLTCLINQVGGDAELKERQFEKLFKDCSAMVSAPSLPSSQTATACYYELFRGCTSLTETPILSNSVLSPLSYGYMFYGCTALSKVTCLATNISQMLSTDNWLYGVASSGTFVKSASMSSWTSGPTGIPSGWNVTNYNE